MNIIQLPVDLQTKILSYLGFCNQLRALQVCKLWSQIVPTSSQTRAARYINWGNFQSKASRLHQIFQRYNYSIFTFQVDLNTGAAGEWRWWRDVETWGETEHGSSNINLSRHPFLDDPILSTNGDEGRRPKMLGRWKKKKVLVTGEPAIWDPDTVKLEVNFATNNEELHLAEWELSSADFTTTEDRCKKPIMEALTIRDVCDAFAMKLKRQIENRGSGPFGNGGLCVCCDKAHWKMWRGSKVIVRMETSRIDEDGAWVIGADLENPYDPGNDDYDGYKIRYLLENYDSEDHDDSDEEDGDSDEESMELDGERNDDGDEDMQEISMELENTLSLGERKRTLKVQEEDVDEDGENLGQALKDLLYSYEYESDEEDEDEGQRAKKRRRKREDNDEDHILEKLREIFAQKTTVPSPQVPRTLQRENTSKRRREVDDDDTVDQEEDLRRLKEISLRVEAKQYFSS